MNAENSVVMGLHAYTEIPEFLGDEGTKLYTLSFVPEAPPKAQIIYIPPFGEEMNRSRALAAEQARAFAASGYACTIMDFLGTGDSQGELEDASLELWLQNIADVADELKSRRDVPCVLWGVRLGGLLTLELARRYPERFSRVLLWSPVVAGTRFVTQLLRLRIAALAGRGMPPETTAEIRESLNAGREVDVAGYPLHAELVSAIESLNIADMTNLGRVSIDWMEYVATQEEPLSRPVQKAFDHLAAQGSEVHLHRFSSAPVWQLQKRHHSPELVTLTSGLVL